MNHKPSTTVIWLSGWASPKEIWQEVSTDWDACHVHLDFLSCLSVSAMKEHVMRAVEGVPLDQSLILIGWSMGGALAMEAALSAKRPVQSIGLISSFAQFTKGEANPSGWHPRVLERMMRKLQKEPRTVLHDFHARMFSESEVRRGFLPTWMDQVQSYGLRTEALLAGLSYLRDVQYGDRLHEIDVPIHLFVGENDGISGVGASRAIFERTHPCTLEIVPEAGHVPFWTEKKRFHQWLKERMKLGPLTKNE